MAWTGTHDITRDILEKSVIDYVLLSDNLIPYISNFHVEMFDKSLSDSHSPICLDLILEIRNTANSENGSKLNIHFIDYKTPGCQKVKNNRLVTENL